MSLPSLLIIGLICWLALVVLVLAVLRAAGLADRAAERRALESAAGPGQPVADDDRASPPRDRPQVRRSALPWLAAVSTLTAVAMTVDRLGGAVAVAAVVIGGGVGAGLIWAIVASWRRGKVIERQAQELATGREAMLALALRLLALRDPAAARHAAAVAHHARLLARAAGLSERGQQIVHSAGLLHDIGRQPRPDALPTGEHRLEDADQRAVRAHALAGAELLRTIAGSEEVAAAVEAHHERIDGTGYPYGLHGDQILQTARIVAIAEVYDTLTAPDSYRGGWDHVWAAHELRGVATTQLDARLVELFLAVVSAPRPAPLARRRTDRRAAPRSTRVLNTCAQKRPHAAVPHAGARRWPTNTSPPRMRHRGRAGRWCPADQRTGHGIPAARRPPAVIFPLRGAHAGQHVTTDAKPPQHPG